VVATGESLLAPEITSRLIARLLSNASARCCSSYARVSEDADAVFAALRAGARGYLLKDADKSTIRAAVAAVARGEAVFGPRVADKVVAFFADARMAATAAFPQLTTREREVLDLIARGLDNRAIARRLALSEKTIRNNVSSILTKLQVADRSKAIIAAREAGFGSTPG
jgi:DNA-binding NarL/FixJ family response regulator